MRNTIKTIAALLIVLGAAKTNASVDSTYVGAYCKVVAQEKEDQFKLIYKGTGDEPISIQWIDENNQIVYKEKVTSKNAFVKQYNLSTLPDGSYRVVVTSEDFSYEEEIILGDLSNMKFVLRELDQKNILLTGFKPEHKDVKLHVYDDEMNQVYFEEYEEGSVIQKKYNFEELNSGRVTFIFTHRGETVTEATFKL